jgi:hypothetical protein
MTTSCILSHRPARPDLILKELGSTHMRLLRLGASTIGLTLSRAFNLAIDATPIEQLTFLAMEVDYPTTSRINTQAAFDFIDPVILTTPHDQHGIYDPRDDRSLGDQTLSPSTISSQNFSNLTHLGPFSKSPNGRGNGTNPIFLRPCSSNSHYFQRRISR